MDVLVLPSQSSSRWQEQFGHVLIEAMAAGVPVIGSDCGAIPEVIGDAGMVFPEGDVEALKERLYQLCRSAALQRRLAHHGRARALSQFTHRHIAERTLAFWTEIGQCA